PPGRAELLALARGLSASENGANGPIPSGDGCGVGIGSVSRIPGTDPGNEERCSRMLRSIGRGMIEIARAIDTGHAIRHGVTPRAYRRGGPTEPSADDALALQRLAE